MESNNNDYGKIIRNVGLFLGIPLVICLLMWLLFDNRTSAGDVKYSDFVGYFERGEVEHFELDLGSGALTVRLRPEFRKEDTNRDEKIDETDVLKYTVPDVNLFLVDVLEEIVTGTTIPTTTSPTIWRRSASCPGSST